MRVSKEVFVSKMGNFALAVVLSCSASAFATPTVSNVRVVQGNDKTVTVTYDLGTEDGIVTADVKTNGVTIGGCHLTHMNGAVNRLVATGNDRSFTWKPFKAWPEMKVALDDVTVEVKAWAKQCPPDYMVVSLAAGQLVAFYPSAEAVPFGVTADQYKTDYLVLRKIPAANVRWRMGSPSTELGRTKTSEVPHVVALTNDYYIGVYPVTQRQYDLVCGLTSGTDTALWGKPVVKVSFDTIRGSAGSGYNWPVDGQAVLSSGFLGRLRTLSGLQTFDLPLDAQWEFAARAGTGTALYGNRELTVADGLCPNLDAIAWYKSNANAEVHEVGGKLANDWGLYDMLGNVQELCRDWYRDDVSAVDANQGPANGSLRCRRGGAYSDAGKSCRCATRLSYDPTKTSGAVGFRVSCLAVIP